MAHIFIQQNGEKVGPLDEHSVRLAIDQGRFTPADLACDSESETWLPLESLLKLNTTTPPPVPDSFCAQPVFPSGKVRRKHNSRKVWIVAAIVAVFSAVIAMSATAWFFTKRNTHPAPQDGQQQQQAGEQTNTNLPSTNFPADFIAQIYEDRVFEVRVRWKERGGFLRMQTHDMQSNGSAVMIDSDHKVGMLFTNWHVVNSPASAWDKSCEVRTARMEQFVPARIVARGTGGLDLAILFIDTSTGWKPAKLPFKRLNEVRAGQGCVAIGNTLGRGLSITTGTISRLDQFGSRSMIRTSSPVSRGNSGGPLFTNTGAALIGIITKALSAEEAQNVSWAIPIEYALDPEMWEFFEQIDSQRMTSPDLPRANVQE